VFQRWSLSVTVPFVWRCLTSVTVNPSPAPATSNRTWPFRSSGFPEPFTSRRYLPLGFRPMVYPSPQFLQCDGRFYHPFPASPRGQRNQTQHGPFAPETLLSFFTTTGHSAILLAFGPFPVSPSYRAYPSPRISPWGNQDFSSFHRVLVTVSPLIPRRCRLSTQPVWDSPCCLRRLLSGSTIGH